MNTYVSPKVLQWELTIEGATWLSFIFFILYSEGMLDGSHEWMKEDFLVLPSVAFLSLPIGLMAWFTFLRRWSNFYLLVIPGAVLFVSVAAYSEIYFRKPVVEGGEWVFMIVFILQAAGAVLHLIASLYARKRLAKNSSS